MICLLKSQVVGGMQLHSTNHFCHCHQPKMSIIPFSSRVSSIIMSVSVGILPSFSSTPSLSCRKPGSVPSLRHTALMTFPESRGTKSVLSLRFMICTYRTLPLRVITPQSRGVISPPLVPYMVCPYRLSHSPMPAILSNAWSGILPSGIEHKS